MPKLRVFIVDDSVVIRRSLADALSHHSDLEVVGAAPSGRIALMKISITPPDVIAVDIDMPEMSGLETLAAIQNSFPRLPVIMLNIHNDRGITATLDALTLGALDYVTKPDSGPDFESQMQAFSNELALKIRACCPETSSSGFMDSVAKGAAKPKLPSAANTLDERLGILVIGASTGGPNALMDLIPRFPANFPIPILIVQHMPPMFTRLFAERLATKSKLNVAEGVTGQQLLPGTAWIAPGDFHMAVARNENAARILIHRDSPENSCRPSADVLFRSAAEAYGCHVLAVVMTGMGKDGFRGCERVHAAGGQILVQDEASSVVWGMPSFVAKAGLADRILPLGRLAAEILSRVWKSRVETKALISG